MSLRVRVSPSALNVKKLLTVSTVGSFFIFNGWAETGFLREYLVTVRRFGEKPGFFDLWVSGEKPGFCEILCYGAKIREKTWFLGFWCRNVN
jgi:hypothetical protein